jgi:hypothetical protein
VTSGEIRQPLTILFGFCAAALSVLCIWQVFTLPINGDVGWFLNCSERVAAGAKLYVDIIDMNPPAVHYYGLPAVWIAKLFSVFDVPVFIASVLCLIAVSLWLSYRALRDALRIGEPLRQICLLGLVYLELMTPLTFVHFSSFAQREHLFIVCVIPYVLHAIARAQGLSRPRGDAIAVGLLAGAGFLTKPHMLAVWIAIEAYLLIRLGWAKAARTPENLAIAGASLAEGLWIVFVTPRYFYVTRLTWEAYGGYNQPFSEILHRQALHFILAGIVSLAACFLLRDSRLRNAVVILLLGMAASLWIAVAQGKGFPYHYMALKAFYTLLAGLVLFAAGEKLLSELRLGPSALLRVSMVAILALLGIAAHSLAMLDKELPEGGAALLPVLKKLAVAKPVIVFSNSVWAGFPVVNYSGALWASRFSCSWYMPALAGLGSFSDPRAVKAVERVFLDSWADEIDKGRPELLIFSDGKESANFNHRKLDYIQYLSQDLRLKNLLGRYRFLQRAGDYQVFELKD